MDVVGAGANRFQLRGTARAAAQLLRFGWLELQACLFPAAVFLGLLAAYALPLPFATYDVLLAWCVVVTVAFWLAGLETWREVLVICGFHVLGLGLELFKVHVGSWSYPGEAVTKVAGVPLFAGFMYAAVGSYICQAWRRFDLRVTHYPAVLTTLVAVGIYANFFTHHWLPDLRVLLAVAGLLVLRRSMVHFTVGQLRHRMPLALAFALIGLFLWLAENAATFLEAWQYPDQEQGWQAVHAAKIGAWALLVTMSFVLVATVKAQEGRLYHVPEHGLERVPSVDVSQAASRRSAAAPRSGRRLRPRPGSPRRPRGRGPGR